MCRTKRQDKHLAGDLEIVVRRISAKMFHSVSVATGMPHELQAQGDQLAQAQEK